MKKKIEEILFSRVNQKCYIIYEQTEDFYVIYGSYIKHVIGGDFYDKLNYFHLNNDKWSFTERHIRHERHNNEKWEYLDKENKQKVIDIDTLYIDGKLTDI